MRHRHFAGGYLLGRRTNKAQLAVAEARYAVVAFSANRWPEDAAGHGTPLINIAAAGCGVERGTRRVIGEVFELGLIGGRGADDAGVEIAGEVRSVLGEPRVGTTLDGGSEFGLGGAQSIHAGAEARSVECVDGESPVTALRAADAAGEEGASAAGGVSERGVDDLDELGIADGKRHERKDIERDGVMRRLRAVGAER